MPAVKASRLHHRQQHRGGGGGGGGIDARTRALVALVLVLFSVAVIALFLNSARAARPRAPLRPPAASAAARDGRRSAGGADAGPLRPFSLWLTPRPGTQEDELYTRLIASLADEHGTRAFAPHVTLGSFVATEAQAGAVAVEVARAIGPGLALEADRVASGDLFFQCVYVLMRESDALLGAHEEMTRALAARGLAPKLANPKYMPHLSLLYSDMGADARAAVAARLNAEDGAAAPGFGAGQLQLWSTTPGDKLMDSWRRVLAYDLV